MFAQVLDLVGFNRLDLHMANALAQMVAFWRLLGEEEFMPITQGQLAERLKAERNRLELTQEEVAERMGVKRPTIAQIEAGNRAVTSIELSQLAAIYKRDVESLLSEKEPEDTALLHLRTNSNLD